MMLVVEMVKCIFLKNKGIKKYFGSDISEIMIDKSKKDLKKLKSTI